MGCYTKFSMTGVDYFLMGISLGVPLDSRLEIWSPEFFKAMKVLVIFLGDSPELDNKSLLLKT